MREDGKALGSTPIEVTWLVAPILVESASFIERAMNCELWLQAIIDGKHCYVHLTSCKQ